MSDVKITREKEDSQLGDSFGQYHLMRNCGLVLRRMGQRFGEDKFDAVDDVLEVLPLLIDTLVKVKEAKDGLIEPSMHQSFDKVRLLRNRARTVDMLANEDEDLESIPIEIRKKGYERFIKNITEYLEGE